MSASQRQNFAVAACAAILTATAAAKFFSVVSGAPVLSIRHSLFPVSTWWVVVLALIAECAVLCTIRNPKRFLLACGSMGLIFVCYHWFTVWADIKGPCSCLGGILGKRLATAEPTIAFLMACSLLCLPFIGLVTPSPKGEPTPDSRPSIYVLTAFVFLACASAVLVASSERLIWGDEGVEAWKVMLNTARPMGPEVWNDQPPLMTTLVSALVGPQGDSAIETGRAVCLAIGVGFAIALACSMGAIGAARAAPIAVLFAWATTWRYLAPFQLEFPAYALAVSALAPLALSDSRKAFWASIGLAVLALNIKLTAGVGLIIPASFLAMHSMSRCAAWCGFTAAGLVATSLIQPAWNWRTMFVSHTASAPEALQIALRMETIADAWPLLLLGIVAVATRYAHGRFASIAPWVVALVFSILLHAGHHPYWDYYSIHFMIPLSVLAAIGCLEVNRSFRSGGPLAKASAVVMAVGITMWIAITNTESAKSIKTWDAITPSAPIAAGIARWQPQGEPMFSTRPHYAVVTGRLPFDHLAVIPRKRFWAGDLGPDDIINTILGSNSSTFVIEEEYLERPEWDELRQRYSIGAVDIGAVLMVRKDLLPEDMPYTARGEKLKRLGL